MRVTIQKGSTERSMSLIDLFDTKTGLTAMQRTTGFTTAIIAEMMAEGKAKTGVNGRRNGNLVVRNRRRSVVAGVAGRAAGSLSNNLAGIVIGGRVFGS